MAKFLAKASYGADGVRGVIKEGGSARVAAVTKLTKKAGGKVEAFYFAYGEWDAYLILDLPDDASAVGLSMAVNASGVVKLQLVPLLTAAQIDAGVKKMVAYTPPGA